MPKQRASVEPISTGVTIKHEQPTASWFRNNTSAAECPSPYPLAPSTERSAESSGSPTADANHHKQPDPAARDILAPYRKARVCRTAQSGVEDDGRENRGLLALDASACRCIFVAQRLAKCGRGDPSASSGSARLKLVGATGFEPATPCAQGRCATGLRYAPTRISIILEPRSSCDPRSPRGPEAGLYAIFPPRYDSYAAMSKMPWPERLKRITFFSPASRAASACRMVACTA